MAKLIYITNVSLYGYIEDGTELRLDRARRRGLRVHH